ncbi:MAG: hypothetical protein ABI315_07350 [Bacteroidia bacterium]
MNTNCTYNYWYIKATVLLIVLFITLPLILNAQKNPSFTIKLKLLIIKGNLENSLITVQKNGSAYKVIDPNKEKYDIDLELGATYTLTFTKQNYITKSIIVDTHVPAGREKRDFGKFSAKVELLQQPSGEVVTYSQPVGRIKYSDAVADFDFDKDYTATAEVIQKKDKELSAPKVKDPIARSIITQKEAPPVPPSKPEVVNGKQPVYPSTPSAPKLIVKKEDSPTKKVVRNKEERIIQKDRLKETIITITIDNEISTYKKVEYSWGGVYFYKNDINITDSAFFKETE